MDLIVKWSDSYPLGQVLFFRGFFGMVIYFFLIPKDRIKNFYKEHKQKLNENLEQKKLLIEKAKLLVADLPNDHKTWEKLSIQLKELQETWKSIGPVPKKVNDKIWNTFREHFDNFYSAKKEFYNERNSTHKNHAQKKKQLIEI